MKCPKCKSENIETDDYDTVVTECLDCGYEPYQEVFDVQFRLEVDNPPKMEEFWEMNDALEYDELENVEQYVMREMEYIDLDSTVIDKVRKVKKDKKGEPLENYYYVYGSYDVDGWSKKNAREFWLDKMQGTDSEVIPDFDIKRII